MKELVKINKNNNGQNVVSAKELYTFLEVKTDFTDWCKRMFEYGFEENVDFNLLKFREVRQEGKRSVQREIIDYALTLDTAKEISMIQRTNKGKQARLYFIDCEKKLQQKPKELTKKELALMIIQIEEEKEQLEIQNSILSENLSLLTHNNETYTTTQIAKELGFSSAAFLNSVLESMKIQFKQNNTWVLYSNYSEKGYTTLKQEIMKTGKIIYHTKWTSLGREFLLNLFKKNK